MKALAKLKDEARKYEQDEEWSKAIEAYLRVLKQGEDGESEVELPLFNRVGDLYVRLGEGESAVAYYETAADRYAEAGLFNNAIALCNKALRYAPDRDDLLHKLGQFSASQGFLTDARRWYLEYAERMFRASALDEAFRALEDYAAVADDASVRELLGRRLHAHGRSEQAVAELKRAYAMRVKAGEHEAAEALRTEIYAIDPDAGELEVEPSPTATPAARRGSTEFTLPGLVELADEETREGAGVDDDDAAAEPTGDARPSEWVAGLESGEFEATDAAAGTGALDGLEPTQIGGDDQHATIDEAEEPAFVLPSHDEPDADPGYDEFDAAEEDAAAAAALPELPGFDDLPDPTALDFDDSAEPASAEDVDEPLPLLSEDGVAVPELSSLDGLGVVDMPTVGESVDEALARARAAVTEGRVDEAIGTLEALYAQLEAAGNNLAAARVLDELVELEPDNVERHRARIETLTAAAESARLVDAYVALAAALQRTGAQQHARAVYQQVLELEPSNAAARAALGPAADKPRPEPVRDDYVDLGVFLTEDDEQVGETTRFFVAEKEPTGDEDRDFAELLAQFKEKISESLSPEDAGSHYDLGLAYKEMGLIDEAISEFQVALRSGDERLKIYEELGHCFLTKGQHGIAVKVLGRAAEGRGDDELELIGVYYYLGRAYEELGQRERARDAYERVLALEVGFQDVGERLARL